jgi:hypothetical protein
MTDIDSYILPGQRPHPRFPFGTLVITTPAATVLAEADVAEALRRHGEGDWGDLTDDDLDANEVALQWGGRLFSAYHDRNNVKFWIITEADRSATTVLLPGDY